MSTILDIAKTTLPRLADIVGAWNTCEIIKKGWSDELKYRIELADGSEALLRLASPDQASRNAFVCSLMESISLSSPCIQQPLAHGLTPDGAGAYTLLTWLHGSDLEEELPKLPKARQYALGRRAGIILRSIHAAKPSIMPRHYNDNWEDFYTKKIERTCAHYEDQDMRLETVDHCIAFARENLCVLWGRPQGAQHGDYHPGNMILLDGGDLGVIDFSRCGFGDPWEDFQRSVWCASLSPAFATGKIDGYFEDRIPEAFFPCLALYTAVNQIGYVSWAQQFGAVEVQTMQEQGALIATWYNRFETTLPSWYDDDMKDVMRG